MSDLNEGKMHPRTLDHTPSRLRDLASVAENLSHEVEGGFDDLQDICNILQDVADEREGLVFDPPLTVAKAENRS